MTKYKFEGYTITNCGYHQPDHCVWWEAVDKNGEACFHGKTLREVEFRILESQWEKKIQRKDEEIEKLKAISASNVAAPRKGKWKNGKNYEHEYAYCSECGLMQWTGWNSHSEAEENIESFVDDYRFCPHCGAEMTGGVYVK